MADRTEAADWIDTNQLGRRNLTADDFRLILGRRYNRSKMTKAEAGASKGKSYPSSESTSEPERTSETLAKEHGVSEKTVRNAGKLAETVERVRAEEPEIAEQGQPAVCGDM